MPWNATQIVRDPQLYVAALAALPVWALLHGFGDAAAADAGLLQSWLRGVLLLTLVYPVLEELVFRGWMQGELLKRLSGRQWGVITLANVLTSALFAGLHLLLRPTWLSVGVFPVSLVFGYFRERHGSLAAPIALHMFYNAGFVLLA